MKNTTFYLALLASLTFIAHGMQKELKELKDNLPTDQEQGKSTTQKLKELSADEKAAEEMQKAKDRWDEIKEDLDITTNEEEEHYSELLFHTTMRTLNSQGKAQRLNPQAKHKHDELVGSLFKSYTSEEKKRFAPLIALLATHDTNSTPQDQDQPGPQSKKPCLDQDNQDQQELNLDLLKNKEGKSEEK